MARIRTIKPDFFTSGDIVECSLSARLLFVGLWCFCDDAGVHPASLRRLKMEVFPGDNFTEQDIGSMVKELVEASLLLQYTIDGNQYWQVTGWHHQKIDKPTFRYPKPKFDEQSQNASRGLGEASPPEGALLHKRFIG